MSVVLILRSSRIPLLRIDTVLTEPALAKAHIADYWFFYIKVVLN